MDKKIMKLLTVVMAVLLLVPLSALGEGEALGGIDLTPILQAVIALLGALITYKLVPWITAKTTEKQRELLRAAVSVSVYAAEQIYGAGNGREKLAYVKDRLLKKGFEIDVDEIEAAVRNLTLIQGDATQNATHDL